MAETAPIKKTKSFFDELNLMRERIMQRAFEIFDSNAAEDILVKAELRHEHEEKKGNVHVCEFASGNLFRTIHLPKRIDPDKVKAEFKNGMLTLKAEIAEEVQTKKISVGAA